MLGDNIGNDATLGDDVTRRDNATLGGIVAEHCNDMLGKDANLGNDATPLGNKTKLSDDATLGEDNANLGNGATLIGNNTKLG